VTSGKDSLTKIDVTGPAPQRSVDLVDGFVGEIWRQTSRLAISDTSSLSGSQSKEENCLIDLGTNPARL
jgi:hypothetical protein